MSRYIKPRASKSKRKRPAKPMYMTDAEFLHKSNRIKKIEKDLKVYEAAAAEQVIVDYPCEVTGTNQHVFQPFWTRAPKAHTRPADIVLPHEKSKAA